MFALELFGEKKLPLNMMEYKKFWSGLKNSL